MAKIVSGNHFFDFYYGSFSKCSKEKQENFLRQLFSTDAILRDNFLAYISDLADPDFNWDELEEPATYYYQEIVDWVGYQFPSFHSLFLDHVFSDDLIQIAIKLLDSFIVQSGKYFDFSKEWIELRNLFLDRLEE